VIKNDRLIQSFSGTGTNYLLLDLARLACSVFFAFSNSRLREAGKPFPPRFMKYCIIRMPEPIPFGLTLFEAMCRAIVSASLVNTPFLGKVDSVVTFLTHRFFPFRDGISTLAP
jgi:hypothetical protein